MDRRQNETEQEHRDRLFNSATLWVFSLTPDEVPETGPVKDVWNMYSQIHKTSSTELRMRLHKHMEKHWRKFQAMDMMYRTWCEIAQVELQLRE